MDTLRGTFESNEAADRLDFDEGHDWDSATSEETSRELPPEAIGQDERRMQVRAYNHWASLLGERTFPSIEDLEPHELPDFGPHSVLLDFSAGIEDPVVQYLGFKLAEECGAEDHLIQRLSDVPPRSLLSRITDHYLQIMANEAPIGFEAEFMNQRGASILYRGILLPFSSDDETIDFIYGVINWKEMADQETADELLLEIDQALDSGEDGQDEEEVEAEAHRHHADPVTDWADSPGHEAGEEFAAGDPAPANDTNVSDIGGPVFDEPETAHDDLPMPDFGQYNLDDEEDEYEDEDEDDAGSYSFASLSDYIEAPTKKAVDLDADKFDPSDYAVPEEVNTPPIPESYELVDPVESFDDSAEQEITPASSAFATEQQVNAFADGPGADETVENLTASEETPELNLAADASLHDCLASARELAHNARASEDRSRHALYAAVGRAYDVSLAAKEEPAEFDALIKESGLTVQDRAPMTPVVKLVFGSEYDKTRLTEYAAVLNHAHRLELARGTLTEFLSQAEGGLKGVVNAERRLRREEAGKEVEPEDAIRAALAEKLRELEALTFEAIEAAGPEFALVMVRRDDSGNVDVLGEIEEDVSLIERAARKLVG